MTIQFDPPIHPGEILREEYLVPLGISAGALAKKLRVPRTRIERIVAETHPITTDTALRLSRFFDTTPQYWMGMQVTYDLANEAPVLAQELEQIEILAA
ncbi:HigA family addiction module antitoxin [Devosia ginsengisoli]|uniref:HigA family addiction module antitoxin n=1 Tax=Devosia ginsengisoli TaxID=400770 RepID=UPI0026EB5CEA|nr:HigA family addiction module antitoxin [Devosia ginsengisoli]MCR6672488.1 HigA family addiction module antitoxin [Devosia ginsengisoli]